MPACRTTLTCRPALVCILRRALATCVKRAPGRHSTCQRGGSLVAERRLESPMRTYSVVGDGEGPVVLRTVEDPDSGRRVDDVRKMVVASWQTTVGWPVGEETRRVGRRRSRCRRSRRSARRNGCWWRRSGYPKLVVCALTVNRLRMPRIWLSSSPTYR